MRHFSCAYNEAVVHREYHQAKESFFHYYYIFGGRVSSQMMLLSKAYRQLNREGASDYCIDTKHKILVAFYYTIVSIPSLALVQKAGSIAILL